MITGAHTIIYSKDAAATREFFRDVLGFPSVDAGRGWLIFALPPSEVAAHPADDDQAGPGHHSLYLMCDDVHKTVATLKAKGVVFTAPITDRGWGLLTTFKLPGAGDMSLYQPRHPIPTPRKPARAKPRAKAKPTARSTKKPTPSKLKRAPKPKRR